MLCQSLKGFLTAIFAAQVSQMESEVLGKIKLKNIMHYRTNCI